MNTVKFLIVALGFSLSSSALAAGTVHDIAALLDGAWPGDAVWQTEGGPFDDTLDVDTTHSTPRALNFGALVRDNIYVWGDYALNDLSFADHARAADFATQAVGLGLRAPLVSREFLAIPGSQGIDLYGGLSVEQMKFDLLDSSYQDFGYGLNAGARAALTPKLELNTGIRYSDFGGSASRLLYTVGTRYNLSPEMSLNLDYARSAVDLKRELGDSLLQVDDDVFTIGFRYLFGKPGHARNRANADPEKDIP